MAREIIGVMPADFHFMSRTWALIVPMQLDRAKVFVGNFSYQRRRASEARHQQSAGQCR